MPLGLPLPELPDSNLLQLPQLLLFLAELGCQLLNTKPRVALFPFAITAAGAGPLHHEQCARDIVLSIALDTGGEKGGPVNALREFYFDYLRYLMPLLLRALFIGNSHCSLLTLWVKLLAVLRLI